MKLLIISEDTGDSSRAMDQASFQPVIVVTSERQSKPVSQSINRKIIIIRQGAKMKLRIRTACIVLLATSIAGPAFSQAAGADTYKTKCAMCHGGDGLAATPMAKTMKVLSFKDPAMVKAPDAQFIASTTNGKGKMPAYKGKLSDGQIKDVVSFIRTLQK
jgi:cytochrome c6